MGTTLDNPYIFLNPQGPFCKVSIKSLTGILSMMEEGSKKYQILNHMVNCKA